MEYDPDTMSDFMKVTVPEGSYEGQIIWITSPDSSERVVEVRIPRGCQPGSSFLVKFPETIQTEEKYDLLLQQEDDPLKERLLTDETKRIV
mmetsp:Transcript_25456/g.31364  ORF Transcript_25456/g.31364 Transcript_25456/m.31364 type:complete len:91 (+) Transcript_25456:333-605(+)